MPAPACAQQSKPGCCDDFLYDLSSGALRAAAARPSSVAEPRTAGRTHCNASRQHDLTGQPTHFSQAPRIWIGLARSRVVAEPLEPCPSLVKLGVSGYTTLAARPA
jgi:hypothetical protein